MTEIPLTDPNLIPDTSEGASEAQFIDEVLGGWQFQILVDADGGGGIPLLLANAATWALIAAGVFLFLCVLFSGIQMMSSNVNKAGMQAARSRLTNCLIGLSIVALAWAVVLILQQFFGLELFGAD